MPPTARPRQRSVGRAAHQRHEAHLVFAAVAERSQKPRRHGRDARLGDAADRHAGVLGLEQHRDAARLEHFIDGDRDLRGQMLLRLQPARIDVDEAGEFRQTDHALDRPVGDMRLAVERHHVMLAMRGETDVADEHEIVVGLGLAEGAGERIGGNFAIAAIKLVQGRDDALWRRDKALAGRIVAEIGDQRAHRGFRLLPRRPIFDGRRRGTDMVRMRLARPFLDDGVHRHSNRRLRLAGTSNPMRQRLYSGLPDRLNKPGQTLPILRC